MHILFGQIFKSVVAAYAASLRTPRLNSTRRFILRALPLPAPKYEPFKGVHFPFGKSYPCATEGTICRCTGKARIGLGTDYSLWRWVTTSVRCINPMFAAGPKKSKYHRVQRRCYCLPHLHPEEMILPV